MVKLLGSGLVAAGFAAVWLRQMGAYRQELALLLDLAEALTLLSDRIRLSRAPLPRLLGELALRPGPAAVLFARVRRELGQGTPLKAAWEQAAGAPALRGDAEQLLAELSCRLTGDEQSVCRGLEEAAGQLRRMAAERREGRRDVARREAALCFSAAAMLIILLI